MSNLPKFKDVAAGETVDWQVEERRAWNVFYYTPYTERAKAWADANLPGVPQHGRSYMFKIKGDPTERGRKLRGHLKREGFVVSR